MITWMLPGAVAVGVVGALYALGTLWPLARRVLPELTLIAAVVLAIVFDVPPIDEGRATLWAWALWKPEMIGLLVLAIAWTRVAPPATGPVPATEALLAGLVFGAVPATAVLAPRANDASHAGRLAVLATASSVLSPVGGPAQALLADPQFTAWAAPVAVAVALIAWPWSERPERPRWAVRSLAPLLALPFGWVGGGMAAIGAYAAGTEIARSRPGPPSPHGLSWGWPIRVALAAIVVVALVQILGIPWGISWTADLGDRVPVIPEGVAALAALPALLIEPFAGAALAERIVSQPSAPPGFMPLLALPLAISPGPALAVAASIRGVRVWRTGLPYALAALGLSVAWIAATLG